MMSKILWIGLALVIVYLIAWQTGLLSRLNLLGAPAPLKDVIKKLPGQEFDLDQTKAKIDLTKLRQGCPVKDCIPAIDNPKFVNAEDAERKGEIEDADVVFAVFHKNVARAYPQRILNWHEIVNDTIAGDPILVTFCPLCGTAIGFERTIEQDGQRVETTFGVSGKLVNSNLVMYDRKTETLWQQLGGEAIIGELVGQKLEPFPVDTLLWKDWKKLHPQTEVLSQDTGHMRDYSRYPYGNYEQDRSVYFPADGTDDDRLHPKQIVWGIIINDEAKAYADDKLAEVKELDDNVGGVDIKIVRNKEGQVRITRLDNNSQIIADRSMWFAWVSFNPETDLYK